jgi:hypothetical protein
MVNTSNKSRSELLERDLEADEQMHSPSEITENEANSSIEQNSVT